MLFEVDKAASKCTLQWPICIIIKNWIQILISFQITKVCIAKFYVSLRRVTASSSREENTPRHRAFCSSSSSWRLAGCGDRQATSCMSAEVRDVRSNDQSQLCTDWPLALWLRCRLLGTSYFECCVVIIIDQTFIQHNRKNNNMLNSRYLFLTSFSFDSQSFERVKLFTSGSGI